MELGYDWIGFQEIFYPHRRSTVVQTGALGHTGSSNGPAYLVVDGDLVIEAFSEQEDLSDWIGDSCEQIAVQHPHRELIRFDRAQVDQVMKGSMQFSNFHAQVEHMRANVHPERIATGKARAKLLKSAAAVTKAPKLQLNIQNHFFVEGMQGWWNKVLPSSYGLYVRVEGTRDHDFLVIVRRGEFIGFQKPDLSFQGMDRTPQHGDVIKYLSEKYLVPVQGIFVSKEEWESWSGAANPWKKVVQAVRTKRARLVPFRFGLSTLMATKAYLHI